MAAGAEPRGRDLRQGLLVLGLLAVVALAGARKGAADVVSMSGNLVLGLSSGHALYLNANGLGIGAATPSANLHVAGNAYASGRLGIGTTAPVSTVETSTLGFGIQTVSSNNTTLSGNSVVLVDTSSGNLTVTLPSPSSVSGRMYTVKKTTNSNTLQLGGNGSLDGVSWLVLTSGANTYPYAQVISDGSAWRVIGCSSDVVAQPLWTPARITTKLWLDAADTTTLTLSSGNVSQWNDKSGNAHHATQGTGSKQPAYISSPAGVSFDGTTDYLTSTIAGLQSQGDLQVFLVFQTAEAAAANYYSFFPWSFGDDNVARLLAYASATSAFSGETMCVGCTNNTGVNRQLGSSTYSRAANTDVCESVATTSTGCRVYQNGTAITLDKANGMTTASACGPSATGYVTNNILYINAVCAGSPIATKALILREMIVLFSEADSATRQQIEGYLAWRWSLTASLPSNHPYKNAAP